MKETLEQFYQEVVLPRIAATAETKVQITPEDVEWDIPFLFLLLHYLKREKHLDVVLNKDTIIISL